MPNQRDLGAQEAALRKVNSQYLWKLVQNDDQSDARLESNEDWLRDEIGYKAQAQDRSEDKHRPNHERQSRRSGEQCCGIRSGHSLTQLGGGQNRDGGGRRNAEN